MIRLSTIVWLSIALAIGSGMFILKHEVQALEDELFRLNRAILAEQQAIHVLRAEWSYVNQPQRIEELARRHLELKPVRPEQLGGVSDLPFRPAAEQAAGDVAPPDATAPERSSTGKPLKIIRPAPPAPAPGGAAPALVGHVAKERP